MINHQSPYGQTIRIPTKDYYDMSDDEIKGIEEKYANSNRSIINFSNSGETDDEYIIDVIHPFNDFDSDFEQQN